MGLGIYELIVILVVFGMGIGGTILWIWMIVDCAGKEPSEGKGKVVWILVIVLTHWVGALIYLLARRPKRIRMHGK